jgi:hypothetical protein
MQTDIILRDYPIDLTHLGILFVLDRKKRCKFYLEDIMLFIELCFEREQGNRDSTELQQMVSACALPLQSINSPLFPSFAFLSSTRPSSRPTAPCACGTSLPEGLTGTRSSWSG